MALLGVNEVGKLQRIAHKEDGRVVAYQIPVAFLGVVLHSKTAHVALRIGRAQFAGDSGEPEKAGSLLAELREQPGAGVLSDVVRNGQRAVSTPTLCVDDALRNPFAVLCSEFFHELVILQKDGTARARGERVLIVGNRSSSVARKAVSHEISFFCGCENYGDWIQLLRFEQFAEPHESGVLAISTSGEPRARV